MVVKAIGTYSTAFPVGHTSFEEQAKDICRMARTAYREYSVILGKHLEDMEVANKKTVQQIAASQRDPLTVIGRIGSIGVGVLLKGFLNFPPLSSLSENWKKGLTGAFDSVTPLTEAGCKLYDNRGAANQTEWQELSGSLRRHVDKAASEMKESENQLNAFLQTIRQLNDDLVQAMRSIRA
jgi:hypothetical protein